MVTALLSGIHSSPSGRQIYLAHTLPSFGHLYDSLLLISFSLLAYCCRHRNSWLTRHVPSCDWLSQYSRSIPRCLSWFFFFLTTYLTEDTFGNSSQDSCHNIHALIHDLFYRSFLHSRANQTLISDIRMLTSCSATMYYVINCFICLSVYLIKNVPSSHSSHAW